MKNTLRTLWFLTVAAVLGANTVWAASEEPKSDLGVARVSLTNGDVTTRRGDSGDWTEGHVNMPLVEGDRLATGRASRAEIQLDFANLLRLNEATEVHLVELANRRFRVQLVRGMVTYSELRNGEADVDIETPQVAVRPLERGNYRIEVTADGHTVVAVNRGKAEIASAAGTETLSKGRTMYIRGDRDAPQFRTAKAKSKDDWDHWNERRDKQLEKSESRRYVSRSIYGAEDLDGHGRWEYISGYGRCWFPYSSVGWAPYRHGRWSWLDYYGWTWVGYEPWAWAPYHYGRWFNHHNYGWGWYPGYRYAHHYWRPALVSFFGYNSYSGFSFGVGFGFGNIGWIPLAPYERYYPWYGRHYYGHGYGRHGGHHNKTTIIVDNSTNIYTNYRNARVNNGVTVVDAQGFSQGRVNNPRTLRASELRRASLMRGQIPVVPARESLGRTVRDSTAQPGARTASTSGGNRFFSRRASRQRQQRTSFDQQRGQIARSVRAFSDRQGQRRAGASSSGDSSPRVGRTSNGQSGASSGSVRTAGSVGRTSGRGAQSRSGASASFDRNVRGRTSGGAQELPSRSRSGAGTTQSAERVATSGSRARTRTSSSASGAEKGGVRNSSAAPGWRQFGDARGIRTRDTGKRSRRSGPSSSSSESRGFPRVDSARGGNSTSARTLSPSNSRSGPTIAPSRSRTSRLDTSGVTSRSRSLDWRRFGGGDRSGSLGRTRDTASSRRGTTSSDAAVKRRSSSSRSFGRTPKKSRSADRQGTFAPRSRSRMTGKRGARHTTSSDSSSSLRGSGRSSSRIGRTSSPGLRLRGSSSSSGRGSSRTPPAGFRNRDGGGYAVPSRSRAPTSQRLGSPSSRGSGSTPSRRGVSRGYRAPSVTRSPSRSAGFSSSRSPSFGGGGSRGSISRSRGGSISRGGGGSISRGGSVSRGGRSGGGGRRR